MDPQRCQCYTNTNAFTGALREALTMIGEFCETQQTKVCNTFADMHDISIEETNKKTEELKCEIKDLKREIGDMKETITQLSELLIRQFKTKAHLTQETNLISPLPNSRRESLDSIPEEEEEEKDVFE
jgi:peptidoglycan hydrolase CwlO-like protein